MNLISSQIIFQKILPFIFFTGVFYINSCSDSSFCSDNEKLNIEYYSSGGFTGGSSGITIDSSGSITFWNKSLGSQKEKNKIIKINEEQLFRICNLLKDSSIFLYKENFVGNYTTHLIINYGDRQNDISFNKSNLPDDMPLSVRNLIKELNNIK